MTPDEFNTNHFINKFSKVNEDGWINCNLQCDPGIIITSSNDNWRWPEPESERWVFQNMIWKNLGVTTGDLEEGNHYATKKGFTQKTSKERVLAALKQISKAEFIDYMIR